MLSAAVYVSFGNSIDKISRLRKLKSGPCLWTLKFGVKGPFVRFLSYSSRASSQHVFGYFRQTCGA